jgi:hypothetical protein
MQAVMPGANGSSQRTISGACYDLNIKSLTSVAGQAKAGLSGWPAKTVSRVASSAINEVALKALRGRFATADFGTFKHVCDTESQHIVVV